MLFGMKVLRILIFKVHKISRLKCDFDEVYICAVSTFESIHATVNTDVPHVTQTSQLSQPLALKYSILVNCKYH